MTAVRDEEQPEMAGVVLDEPVDTDVGGGSAVDDIVVRISAMPKGSDERRAAIAALSAGMPADELKDLVYDLVAKRNSKMRIAVAVEVTEALTRYERAEVLSLVEYELPALVAAYDESTPAERKELDRCRPPAAPRKAGKTEPVTDLVRDNLTALSDLVADLDRRISGGASMAPEVADAYRHQCMNLLSRALNGMGGRPVRGVQSPPDPGRERKRRWNNEPESGRKIWRQCDARRNDPDVLAINSAALTDRPVGHKGLRSQFAGFAGR